MTFLISAWRQILHLYYVQLALIRYRHSLVQNLTSDKHFSTPRMTVAITFGSVDSYKCVSSKMTAEITTFVYIDKNSYFHYQCTINSLWQHVLFLWTTKYFIRSLLYLILLLRDISDAFNSIFRPSKIITYSMIIIIYEHIIFIWCTSR